MQSFDSILYTYTYIHLHTLNTATKVYLSENVMFLFGKWLLHFLKLPKKFIHLIRTYFAKWRGITLFASFYTVFCTFPCSFSHFSHLYFDLNLYLWKYLRINTYGFSLEFQKSIQFKLNNHFYFHISQFICVYAYICRWNECIISFVVILK